MVPSSSPSPSSDSSDAPGSQAPGSQALERTARRRTLSRVGVVLAVMVAGAALAVGCGSEDGNVEEGPATEPSSTKADAGRKPPSTDAGKPPRPEPDPEPDPDPDAGQPDAGQPEGGLQPDGTCLDPNDPGDTDAGRRKLPDTNDDQDMVISVFGVLNGKADVDQYTLSMDDTQGHLIGKGFTAVTPDVEVCVYVQCKNGRELTANCGKDVPATKKLGTWPGCCATKADIPLGWDCKGLSDNDSVDFIISAQQKKDMCTSYQIDYTF